MLLRISRQLRRIEARWHEYVALSELSSEERELISHISGKNITYLTKTKLASLAKSCRAIEHGAVSGVFIEAGCALGGSTLLIAKLKNKCRPFYVYDVYGMIPPPTVEDTLDVHERYSVISKGMSKGIDGGRYYGYENDLYDVVLSNLKGGGVDCQELSVHLVKGLIQETLILDFPVALAHIDVDWYEPVRVCLERIFPRLVIHGSIIVDDYYVWGGCKKAVDEYLYSVAGQYVVDGSSGAMKITRIS